MTSPLSRDKQIQEILKCGKDPIHFIKSYCKIQHQTRGLIPFETYEFQDNCVNDFQKHRFNIVLKSRQLGLSTVTAAYVLWYALFKKDKNILVIATKLPTAVNFIKKVKTMLTNIPKWLVLSKFDNTLQAIRFANGSTITAVPTSEDAGRSEALALLVVDEAAWIRDFSAIWTGLSPTLSTGGSAIILSTPNGVGGQYYKLWTEAEAGENGFNPIRLPWHVHPEHDEEWFKHETKNIPRRTVAQEYLCDFLSSGDTFLQPNDLDRVRDSIRPPIERSGPQNAVWTWKKPETGRKYVLSADVARGDSSDYATFHVIDYDSCEVCAEFMGKIPPDALADLLADFGKKYNNALICPEQNTFGYITCKKLQVIGYPRLWYFGAKGDPFEYRAIDPEELCGFSTQTRTRHQILAKLEEMIRNDVLKTYSQRLYDEFQAFVWQGSKASAMKDAHDDLVMSIAIGAWLTSGGGTSAESGMDMAYAMLKATSVGNRSINELPGGINDVRPVPNQNIMGFTPQNVSQPRDPSDIRHVDVSDFSWLFK